MKRSGELSDQSVFGSASAVESKRKNGRRESF